MKSMEKSLQASFAQSLKEVMDTFFKTQGKSSNRMANQSVTGPKESETRIPIYCGSRIVTIGMMGIMFSP
jgi:hypothetical protein